jgi:hypothetical protein
LHDGLVSAETEGMRVAVVRLGPREATGNVQHEAAGIVGATLANHEARHELRLLVDAGPEIDVPLVVLLGLFLDGEASLLFGNKRPLLVELKMGQREVGHTLVQEPTAGVPEVDDELADRVAVQAGGSLRRTDRHAFGQQPQGELGIGHLDTHRAERLLLRLGESLAAQAALVALDAVAVFSVLLNFGVGTGNHHGESLSASAALARMALPEAA